MAKKVHTPIRSIRLKCLDCCAGSAYEIKLCPCTDCTLHPYRFGVRPSTAQKKHKLSENNSKLKETDEKTAVKEGFEDG